MKRYYTAMSYAKLHHKQAGMTLIELTVVLLILVGLAGLLIPYVGSFVQKTHDSTASSNMAQLNNAMMRFTVEKNRVPHHMESLINANAATVGSATGACVGATAGAAYCGLLNASVFTPVTYTTAANQIQIDSLYKAGLTMFVGNDPDAVNKTFNNAKGMYYLPGKNGGMMENGTFLTINAGDQGTVVKHISYAVGGAPMDYSTTCYDYIVMGIGDKNELIGNSMTAAPVHFPEMAELGPVQRYNHFMGVFQVDKSNTGTSETTGKPCSEITEKAKFLGTVMNIPTEAGNHLVGVGQSLSYTYENQAAGK